MKKLLISSLGVVVLLASFAVPVMAAGDNGQFDSDVNDPPINIGAGWSATSTVPPAFFWSGTIPVYSSSGPFTFTSVVPVTMDVTDDFLKGDQFNVYDNTVLVGTTSLVAVDATSPEVGPDAAFADATYSSGSFILGPGSHSIDIEAIGASFTSGRGYIRITTVLVDVDIDIKPWSDPNSVNRNKKGVIPVGILGGDNFDPTLLDHGSDLTFEFCGTSVTPKHDLSDPLVYDEHIVYPWQPDPVGQPSLWVTANNDMIPDLVVHFNTQDLTIVGTPKNTVQCTLIVKYGGNDWLQGSDDIRIVK